MSWWATGISVGTSLLSSSMQPEDESWKAEAAKAGQRKAGLIANRDRALALLPAQAQQESEAAAAAKLSAEQGNAQAKASAAVQAAASGTKGISVDQTIAQLDSSTAMVGEQIERTKAAKMLQLDQDRQDTYWDAAMQEYDVKVNNTGGSSTGQKLLAAGLDGVSAYLAV